MADWFSIEVLNAGSSARSWVESFGDAITEAGLESGALNWEWHHHEWGSLLEIEFSDEEEFELFRNRAIVQAALDAVPDRINGLSIHRGRGGSSGTRRPRRPVPVAGAGAVELPLPRDDVDWLEDDQPVTILSERETAERLTA